LTEMDRFPEDDTIHFCGLWHFYDEVLEVDTIRLIILIQRAKLHFIFSQFFPTELVKGIRRLQQVLRKTFIP
jgi:hypothetical protein